jgi:hypothetical protein
LENPDISANGQGLYKRFTEMHLEGKPANGPLIIEETKIFMMKSK